MRKVAARDRHRVLSVCLSAAAAVAAAAALGDDLGNGNSLSRVLLS